MSQEKDLFGDLLATMRRLRSPEGCPWDREQTLESLRSYLIEEAYEVIDAIDRRDWTGLAEELGDLQLQVVFQAEIAHGEGWFDIRDVLEAINSKLVRRHPHVFESETAETAEDVARRWEQIKRQEKQRPPDGGLLETVPRHQPDMLEARQADKLAAKAGFDWQRFEDMGDKLAEEFGELIEARRSGGAGHIEDEVGDLLFMAVNVARYCGVDPELALKRANAKFRRRFGSMERALAAEGREIADCTPAELEQLWQRAKQG
ncbi:MAG: nucleoside triphosphate pyrophosphohydrolase [Bryobacterales bacterium]|nr:nucleoside triphosphate pyrophosphohydrolase [Bryobacterales bacterium]